MTGTVYRTPDGRRAVEAAYGRALEGWPVPARRRTVATSQGDTFVMDSGPEDAPALLLLHGSGTNSAIWMGDVAAWAARFRVVAVDVIGEPGLSAPSRPPLGSGAYAQWLDDVLGVLGLARVSLVGASLGGWLALDYAIRRPERVEHLVLLCPGGVGGQRWGWMLKALMLRPFGDRGLRKTFEIVTGLTLPGTRSFLDYMTLIHRQFRPRRQRLPIFSDAALAGLAMPIMVIAGGRDALLDSNATAERIARAVPGAEIRLLPGVGHAIVGQTATILAFLEAS